MSKKEVVVSKVEKALFTIKGKEVEGYRVTIEGVEEPIPYFGLKESTPLLKFGYPQYTRTRVTEGKLDTPYPSLKLDFGSYLKWVIAYPSILEYRSRVRRESTLRRFILYIPEGEKGKVESLLEKAGIEYRLEYSYTKGKGKKGNKKDTSPPTPLKKYTL